MQRDGEAVRVSVKFKPQDLWIGAYWERGTEAAQYGTLTSGKPYMTSVPTLSVWVCLIPMLPIKLHFGGGEGRDR